MTRDRARLLEMLDAIERITRYTESGRTTFVEDELIHSAVLYRIGSLGESAKGVSSRGTRRFRGSRSVASATS